MSRAASPKALFADLHSWTTSWVTTSSAEARAASTPTLVGWNSSTPRAFHRQSLHGIASPQWGLGPSLPPIPRPRPLSCRFPRFGLGVQMPSRLGVAGAPDRVAFRRVHAQQPDANPQISPLLPHPVGVGLIPPSWLGGFRRGLQTTTRRRRIGTCLLALGLRRSLGCSTITRKRTTCDERCAARAAQDGGGLLPTLVVGQGSPNVHRLRGMDCYNDASQQMPMWLPTCRTQTTRKIPLGCLI